MDNSTIWYTDKLPPKPDTFPNNLGSFSIRVWIAYDGMEDVGYYNYLESKWVRDEDGEVIDTIDAWCELPHFYKNKKCTENLAVDTEPNSRDCSGLVEKKND